MQVLQVFTHLILARGMQAKAQANYRFYVLKGERQSLLLDLG